MHTTKCYSPSSPSLNTVLEAIRQKVSIKETGASWDTIEQGVIQLTDYLNNGGCTSAADMLAAIRSLSSPVNNALNSERTRLSSSACKLITAVSAVFGPAFEPLVSLFIHTLLELCARSNKVFVTRAKACILAMIQHTQSAFILSHLAKSVHHKSASLRLAAAEGVLACINYLNPSDATRARLIEDVIKLTFRDASEDVRATGKKICEAYKPIRPDRMERLVHVFPTPSSFVAPSPVVEKPLEKQGTAALRSTQLVHSRSRPMIGIVRPVRPVRPSARQDALRLPSEPASLPAQCTNLRRDVTRPVVPTTKHHQQVENAPMRTELLVRKGTKTVPSAETTGGVPKSLTSHATSRGTRSQVGQSRSNEPATTGVELQTPSQAPHTRALAPRSGWQAVGQRNPMSGGRSMTKKPVAKAHYTASKISGVEKRISSNPLAALADAPLPPHSDVTTVMVPSPVSRQFEAATARESPVQATTPENVQHASPPCIDDTPSRLPRRKVLLTPFRPSDRLQRGPRRPRHVPKRFRHREHAADSICIDTNLNASIHPPDSEIDSTPFASCIQHESLFAPLSHDNTIIHVQQDGGLEMMLTYSATPSPRDANAQDSDVVTPVHPTTNDNAEPRVTLYQPCELRRVIEGLTDVVLDHAMTLFYI